jgi:pimeloyl-ACP methyl ester carboxylesterase
MYLEVRGNGQPVLLLHGQPGYGKNFEQLVAKLVANHTLLIPDRPGYGKSFGPPQGFDELAVELKERVTQLGLSDLIVVGYSFGAGSAIYFSNLAHHLTKALCLIAPIGTRRCLTSLDYILAKPYVGPVITFDGMVFLDIVLPRLKRLLLNSNSDLIRNTARLLKLDLVADSMISPKPLLKSLRSFVKEQRILLDQIDKLESELPKIDLPIHIISGQKDEIISPESILDLQSRLKSSSLTWVKNGTHLLIHEKPELLAEIISSC